MINTDGSNKNKIIEVDYCTNVQFIPNTNKILFMTSRDDDSHMYQIHTVNIDGTDSLQISGEYLLRDAQPAVSDDGNKIVFWALHQSRDYAYDLYMTDPLGTEITNLTNTENESEKEASFISYQGQEYLLYVTYFSENYLEYSTVNLMNTTTFTVDTLYVEEIEEERGFRLPTYHSDLDLLFVALAKVDTMIYSNIISYDSLYDGNPSITYTLMYNRIMEINTEFNMLIFSSSDIMVLDIDNYEINFLADGYWFNSFNEKVVYSSGGYLSDSNIYSISIDGSNNVMLSEDGIYPQFSYDGEKIVYIGKYITNPRRDLLTN
jgi:Tol biopolymer transport system component